MIIDIIVPTPGESISEVQIASWLVENGAGVAKNMEILEVDSDKATLSITAEATGKIEILVEEGETVDVGSVIARIDTDAKVEIAEASAPAPLEAKEEKAPETKTEEAPKDEKKAKPANDSFDFKLSPLARKLIEEENIDASELEAFYKSLRVGVKDIEFFKNAKANAPAASTKASKDSWEGGREQKVQKMSMLRKKLAQRLVSVKNETAMLTTFNEVNMTPIFEIRKKYKEQFKETHGVGLGFMSFFTKACTIAMKQFPQINSMIDGDQVVSFEYTDVSIAVSSPKGLVVPVVRNAEMMSLAEIEADIKRLAIKARDGKLSLDEMTGGTFTITNGGVFGSMLSTPIINPPQSAILGMHNIVERPIAVKGKVEIHPIMYVALSYDHRIVDGRESVGFLVKVKELLENPEKMLFDGAEPVAELLGV
ncbi:MULTISPECIES: 2-oxoglutarate dehydrogenase complex dihydrolipoyllysine-residue succinyltransferase [unclassified Lentimicrobium]|uniref:2-oxoglutarate dehydrogenase complex dihydrolipoyllysine-residue succinyltransferase n=1 Tax=unclassified Lentimicrobium TaxID=2677434 RepID=UPI001558041B|nr:MULTISPECIES: 2-oxoglutarate dehydrogenase complex dihydrolipoyllysine-residue succinyltransferase [unclassified Lentimicrobium]NPD45408.1 2-oxoglutarate dehydrogenase complex dihydrolipoyllysine-residue succinyltransferase [Lentimicrobium sp. S6]NPD84893.1 2-oxoglutarate dehydrogenase complex dihydrolipoyllysine-residue succinyltransferase [Lentimicrobium sp. L6]